MNQTNNYQLNQNQQQLQNFQYSQQNNQIQNSFQLNNNINGDSDEHSISSIYSPYWKVLLFDNNVSNESFMKHLILTYRGLVYSTRCLKSPSDKFINSKKVNMIQPKNWLYLDLDETLIHTVPIHANPDHILYTPEDVIRQQPIGLKIRPGMYNFLQQASKNWNIYIYTASSICYAKCIINFIDPQRQYINDILHRSNCMETKNGFFIKDLRITNTPLQSSVIVDNFSHSFGFQIYNGIPILEWTNDPNDTQLTGLIGHLNKMLQYNDVREYTSKVFKLDQLAQIQSDEI